MTISTQILSDVNVDGSIILIHDYPDFPLNPKVGQFCLVNKQAYFYLVFQGVETWYPFAAKPNYYLHTQALPALTWTVNHNLGTNNLFVQIRNSAGNLVTASMVPSTVNSFQVQFTSALSGTLMVLSPADIDVPVVQASYMSIANGAVVLDSSGVKINGTYALTEAAVALKADTTDLTAEITARVAAVALKANVSYVDAEIIRARAAEAVLAPQATTYTMAQVDSKVAGLSVTGNSTTDFSVKSLAVSGNILPAITGVSNIGSPTDKFHSIYTKELHLDANTLYIDGSPVIGSSANTIQITADLNQGMRVATSGTGQLILDSQTATTVQTNGTNADVVFQAIGIGSMARITAATQVVVTTPIVNIQGSESISGDLTVAGNMTVNGTTTAVNTTNMVVKDNIVTVNKGELGSGVSLRYAGFEVDRGDLARQRLIWDETVGKWVAGQTSQEAALATEPFVTAAVATAASGVTVASLGLANVSNTSDANKPVSIAQAAAIGLKADIADLLVEIDARVAADLLAAPKLTTYTKPQVDLAITTSVSGKVDKVTGKGLSTEDYTTAEKIKLATLGGAVAAANVTLQPLFEHNKTISANYAIASGNNAMSVGPLVTKAGVSVTVPALSRWVVL